jgi:hypothetical protein
VKRCYALSSLTCCILPSLPYPSTAKPGTFCLVFYALLLPALRCLFCHTLPFCHVTNLPCTVSLYNTAQSAMQWPVHPKKPNLPCTVSLYNTAKSAMHRQSVQHCPVFHALASPPQTAPSAMHRSVCLVLTFLPGFWPVHHALLSRHNITPSAMHCPVCNALLVYPSLPSLPNNAHSVVHCLVYQAQTFHTSKNKKYAMEFKVYPHTVQSAMYSLVCHVTPRLPHSPICHALPFFPYTVPHCPVCHTLPCLPYIAHSAMPIHRPVCHTLPSLPYTT